MVPGHPLGEFSGAPHLAGRAALLGASALAATLDRLQLSWRALEPTTWWASNGRDMLLGFSVGLQMLALVTLGFPPAAALVGAAQLTLAAVVLEALLLRRRWIRAHHAVAIGAAMLLTLPMALAPERAFALIDAAAQLASRR